MYDDELAHGHTHSLRVQLSELLDERRIETANDVVVRLRDTHEMNVSPLIVRTLVHTIAKSLAEGSPDAVVHWSRMVRHAHPPSVVFAMIDTICDVAQELGHGLEGDFASVVVFLEILKVRSR